MNPNDPAPRRRTCGLCAQQGHDRRQCRAAALYRADYPEMTYADLPLHRGAIRALAEAGLPPAPPPPPRIRCIMNQDHPHWGARFQCRNMSTPGGQYCPRCDATRPRLDLPPEQRCQVGRCTCIIADRGLCRRHLARDLARRKAAYLVLSWGLAVQRMENDPTSWPQIVEEWTDHMPPAELGGGLWWRHQIRTLRVRLAHEYFIRDLWNLDHPLDPMDANGVIDWHWNRRARAAAPQHAPGTLAAFVADTQNVHTGVVSKQTHEGVKKLLAAPVHAQQSDYTRKVVETLLNFFVKNKRTTESASARIRADFEHWYKQDTCRQMRDWLYKRVIDGLIMTIQGTKAKDVRHELYKRLCEEMSDSVGTCCDGHITRLINVMSGFDEAFVPEKTIGEKTQELFAALSAKECSLLEKVADGVRGLRALQVPEDEWEPWIDAL